MSVDRVLAKLAALHPKRIDLSLARILRLLEALGQPHLKLPPVIHVAGTNGKGSVTAYLAAMARAQGLAAHVYISPHLVRFNERIVLRDRQISDEDLLELLHRTEAANAGAPITFFEVTTAAAFLAFAELPADLVILETGLGGRLDATNVVPRPAVTVLTSISLDHQDFLGPDLAGIAAEKAAILKPGVPAVTAPQDAVVQAVIDARASSLGISLATGGRDWLVGSDGFALSWQEPASGTLLALPMPGLPGPHQLINAGVAIAAARALSLPVLAEPAIAAGLKGVVWPGRLQPVAAALLPDAELWLDGGHNPAAGLALAAALREMSSRHDASDRPLWLVVGMKPNKDARAYLAALAPLSAGLVAVPIPAEDCLSPERLVEIAQGVGIGAAVTARDVPAALTHLAEIAPRARLVICGSLYLVGSVLASPVVTAGADPAVPPSSRASSTTAAR